MPNQSQKPVDIGGQAVLEGVMMKGPDAIAITVRRPDKTMVVDYKKAEPLSIAILQSLGVIHSPSYRHLSEFEKQCSFP